MSFILDQLKKSGKKRELELAMRSKAGMRSRENEGASQADFQPKSGPMINMRTIYLLLFLAVFSSALGGFILLQGNPVSRQAPVVSTKAQIYTAETSRPKAGSPGPASVSPAESRIYMPTNSLPEAGPEEPVPAPSVLRDMPDGKVKSSAPIPTDVLQNHPESAAKPQIADPSPPDRPEIQDDASRMPYLNELPASLKNALPPVRITSHLYRGNSKLVSINGKIMSEGVNMGEGLFLDEITPEGVILSFRGQRFRVKAD